MITDKNEAFQHNACKKLAQLSKVIFSMTAQSIDRRDAKTSITIDFEQAILDILETYDYHSNVITKQLIKFRKKCIDKSCSEFASLYKKTKAELGEMIKVKTNVLNNVLLEVRGLKKEIRNIQLESLKTAAGFLDNADNFQVELRTFSSGSISVSKSAINAAIEPINLKIRQAKASHKERVKLLGKHQEEEISKIRDVISTFVFEELSSRKPILQEMKQNCQTLNSELKDLIQTNQELGNKYNLQFNQWRKERNRIMADTNLNIKNMKMQMQNVVERNKTQSRNHQSTLYEKGKIRDSKAKTFEHEKSNIKKQVRQIKRDRHQLEKDLHDLLLQREKEIEIKSENEQQLYLSELEKLTKNQESIRATIGKCHREMNQIICRIKSAISSNLENVGARKRNFHNAIAEELNGMRNTFEEQRAQVISDYDEQILQIEEQITAIQKEKYKNEKKEVHTLKKALRKLNTENSKSAMEKIKSEQEQIDKLSHSNRSKIDEKKSLLNTNLSNRFKEKKKKIAELKKNFADDLQKHKEQFEKEHKEQLSKYQSDYFNQTIHSKDEKEHQVELSKRKARYDVFVNQIIQVNNDRKIRNEKLQGTINNLDKQKRQFQRFMKTEIQQIDEEFEMKIQICQVNLRNTIENISKLFDEDENTRGRDIIEGIRKVKEAKNVTSDMVARRNRQINEMVQQFHKTKECLELQINNFQTNQQEKQLEQKISEIKQQLDENLALINEKADDRIVEIKKNYENEKHKLDKTIADIKHQVDEANKTQKESLAKLKEQHNQIEKEAKNEISTIEKQFQEQKHKVVENHHRDVALIKKRIEAAKQTRKETIEGYSRAQNELKNNLEKEYTNRLNENNHLNDVKYNPIKLEITELENKATSLALTIKGFEKQKQSPVQRSEEATLIESNKKKLFSAEKRTAVEFKDHINYITDLKKKIDEESKNIINSIKAKNLAYCAKNVIIGNEICTKRVVPQLVTPQLVLT